MLYRAIGSCLATLVILLPIPAAAQRSAAPATQSATEATHQAATQLVVNDSDAEATRQQLMDILEKYPPSVGRVLKIDPTLMGSQDYLAAYPALAAFLAQHPAVPHNPGFYLERVSGGSPSPTDDPRWQARQAFDDMLGNLAAFLVFLVVTGVLVWLIRLFVDNRRWNRLSKIQTDVHTKLLDRFTNNEDLLAYMQTPAGKRFLESAPIQIHEKGKPIGAPFARILWSVQAGVVLALAGFGLLFVSTRFSDEPAQFFFVVGIVTLALGVGFAASAGAAYALSRRLGLLEEASVDHA